MIGKKFQVQFRHTKRVEIKAIVTVISNKEIKYNIYTIYTLLFDQTK